MKMKSMPPDLDMTPDGRFLDPPATPVIARVVRGAIVVAAISGVAAAALLALWFALLLIPVAIGAGLLAWAAFRFQLWRAGRSFGRERDLSRPPISRAPGRRS